MAAVRLAEEMRAAVAAGVNRKEGTDIDALEASFMRAASCLSSAFRAMDERRRWDECESIHSVQRSNDEMKAQLEAQTALLERHRAQVLRWHAECVECRKLALSSYPGAPPPGANRVDAMETSAEKLSE
eukprot:scaffold19152_cov31-Tisochrysis_lutea.AAC.1